MMKTGFPARVGVAAAAAAALLVVPDMARSQDFPPVAFKIISGTLGTPGDLLMKKYWTDIGAKTKGKIVVRVQAREELGLDGAEVYRMAKLGVAEVTSTALAYNAGEVPQNDGVDLVGLGFDLATMRKVADSWMPELRKAYTDKIGLELLGVFPIVGQVMWCNVPITGIDDLKGKKIRVAGTALSKLVGGFGAVATTISFAEVVPSLQRNVIDCAITGTTSGNLSKWTEVTTHVMPMVTGWAVQGVYGNKKWWAGLNVNAKKAISGVMDEMIAEAWKRSEDETNHGIWCSVGDSRCNPNATIKPLGKYNLKLVAFSDADKKKLTQAVEKEVLPDFSKRCGKACAEAWNATVGKVLGAKTPVN